MIHTKTNSDLSIDYDFLNKKVTQMEYEAFIILTSRCTVVHKIDAIDMDQCIPEHVTYSEMISDLVTWEYFNTIFSNSTRNPYYTILEPRLNRVVSYIQVEYPKYTDNEYQDTFDDMIRHNWTKWDEIQMGYRDRMTYNLSNIFNLPQELEELLSYVNQPYKFMIQSR